MSPWSIGLLLVAAGEVRAAAPDAAPEAEVNDTSEPEEKQAEASSGRSDKSSQSEVESGQTEVMNSALWQMLEMMAPEDDDAVMDQALKALLSPSPADTLPRMGVGADRSGDIGDLSTGRLDETIKGSSESSSADIGREDVELSMGTLAGRVGDQGALGPDVKRVLQRNQGQLEHCFEKELREAPSARGRATISLVIDEKGRVSKAWFEGISWDSVVFEDCALRRVRRWQFPPLEGEVTTVSIPLVLRSGE